MESISQALLLSLGANCLVYFLVPLFSRATLAERLQSNKFVSQLNDSKVSNHLQPLSYHDLGALLQRFAEKVAVFGKSFFRHIKVSGSALPMSS